MLILPPINHGLKRLPIVPFSYKARNYLRKLIKYTEVISEHVFEVCISLEKIR